MMGGYSFEENCEVILPETLVLVGKTRTGKSATGNSILGMQTFKSKKSFSGVTRNSELKKTTLEDGQILNMIDTPGLFDSSLDIKIVGKEIVSCIRKAKDGVDAFIVVISISSHFGEDEKAAISTLCTLFGNEVFTGGDGLEENENLEDILDESPKALQETLGLCGNRYVLFDNKTKDPIKRSSQVRKLLSLVKIMLKNNGGKPYTNELFTELKKVTKGRYDQYISACDEQFKLIYEMVESKLKEKTLKFEKLLDAERIARLNTEEELQKLREELEEAKKREEEHKKKTGGSGCNIL